MAAGKEQVMERRAKRFPFVAAFALGLIVTSLGTAYGHASVHE